jgi:hypothetical protein
MRFELYYANGIFGGTFGSMIIARREEGMGLAGNKS